MKSITALQKELAAKQRTLAALKSKRTGLAKQLAKVDRQIAGLSGGAAAPKPTKKAAKKARRRRVKQKPLAQFVQDVLAKASKPMQAVAVATAVLEAGYKTKNNTFKATVNQLLSKRPQFKRVSRGLYRLAAKK